MRHGSIPCNNRMDSTKATVPATVMTATGTTGKATLLRGMSLWDAVLLLVGGIIGSGLFLTSSDVAASTHTPFLFMLAWVFGGVVSILACYVFAELGSMY